MGFPVGCVAVSHCLKTYRYYRTRGSELGYVWTSLFQATGSHRAVSSQTIPPHRSPCRWPQPPPRPCVSAAVRRAKAVRRRGGPAVPSEQPQVRAMPGAAQPRGRVSMTASCLAPLLVAEATPPRASDWPAAVCWPVAKAMPAADWPPWGGRGSPRPQPACGGGRGAAGPDSPGDRAGRPRGDSEPSPLFGLRFRPPLCGRGDRRPTAVAARTPEGPTLRLDT